VLLDGVFNHCGSFNKWMDHEGIYLGKAGFQPGAFQSVHSPYRSYFKFNDSTNGRSPAYEGWWGYTTLPKLNYEESPELCEEAYQTLVNKDSQLVIVPGASHAMLMERPYYKVFREKILAFLTADNSMGGKAD